MSVKSLAAAVARIVQQRINNEARAKRGTVQNGRFVSGSKSYPMVQAVDVDTVSGLQVRADGKWLSNHAVKADDLVWTDGRCVYGHDRESQSPLVIALPKEDWAKTQFQTKTCPER